MLHIYFGNGKGKTTAAAGLAVRASGAGLKTVFFQFLKDGTSSEISVLRGIENVRVVCCEECDKFCCTMNANELESVVRRHDLMLREAMELIETGNAGLVILDEFLDAYNEKLLDTELADSFISGLPGKCEVVMTGRSPAPHIMDRADYITEMTALKHPYSKGAPARPGIEY